MVNPLQVYLQKEPLRIPDAFDIAAVLLFSLSGVLAAMRRKYDPIGVFTMALVTGAGGGLIRDGLFLQQGPPALTQNWRLVPAVLGACLIGWMVMHWVVRFQKIIAVLDAIGLSVFSLVGLSKAIDAGLSTPASVLVGVVNAAGGGILRDVLTGEEPLFLKPGQFYVLASLAGCVVFVILAYETEWTAHRAALISMASIFVLRISAIIFNWRTAPLRPWFDAPLTHSETTNPPPPT